MSTAVRDRYGVALFALAFLAVMIGTTMPTPMYALYSERMSFSVVTTTVVYATYAAGVLATLLLVGRWSDVLGRRPMLLAAIAIAAASDVVFLLAESVPTLLVGRVLSGVSAGVFTGTATAAIIEAAPPSWTTRAPAVATVANIGGLGLGPVIAGVLVQYAPAPLHLSFALHLAVLAAATAAVVLAPETAAREGRLGVQRLSVPAATRPVFLVAATAAFAGFAVMGLFTAVAPSFVAGVIGNDDHALAGLVAASVFAASALAQVLTTTARPPRTIAAGCALLVIGMVGLAAALAMGSLPLLIVAALVAGTGQGMSFGRGLAAVSEATPPHQRAEVNSTYFVVAYVAISLPVIGEGVAARALGLQAAGVAFAVIVAVLAAGCLLGVLRQQRAAR